MRVVCIILLSAFLFSCEKKELPVTRADRGDVLTTQIDMGSDYRRQVWFSLYDNRIVSVNAKTDWDLAFETSPGGAHIFMNGSKAMRVFKTAFSDLSQVTDTAGLGVSSKADMPSGNADSTAIGDWKTDNKVYIVNRGYNESGLPQGFYKLKIKAVTASHFSFEYADIYRGPVMQAIVAKDENYNFVMYSLGDHAQKQPEPKKTDYDLCFTQYTHLFLDPLQYYQVTGVLSNCYTTRIAIVKDKPFAAIGISDTIHHTFLSERNAIGYDWKSFDLNTNLYTVNPALCYIIHDHKGYYYKLHFIDFVNSSGEKGFPKFEFKRL